MSLKASSAQLYRGKRLLNPRGATAIVAPAQRALLQAPPMQRAQPRTSSSLAATSAEAMEALPAPPGVPAPAPQEREIRPGVWEGFWLWDSPHGTQRIRYHRSGSSGPPLLCVHGFGGNADHFRHQLSGLGQLGCRVWAVDLLGYGFSDKPSPRQAAPNAIYNFHTWARQLLDFMDAFVGEPAFVVCNSVGGLAGLQAALDRPSAVRGVQIMNISLRMLHASKQAEWQRPLVAALQRTLRESQLGPWFFSQIATRKGVRNVLEQCYCNKGAVTDELVDYILKPGLEPRAVDVFLDFISYSSGPLPEQQLAEVKVPVSVIWGAEDPWEKVEWGRQFVSGSRYPAVEEFIELPGVGHCPQDEAPHLVNPLVLSFVQRHRA